MLKQNMVLNYSKDTVQQLKSDTDNEHIRIENIVKNMSHTHQLISSVKNMSFNRAIVIKKHDQTSPKTKNFDTK